MTRNRVSLPSAEAIGEWLPGQRWFGAKTRRIERVMVDEAIPLGPGVVVLVDVELDGGGRDRYAIPLLPGGEIREAVGDVEFCRALLGLLARAGVVAGARGEIRGVPAKGLPERWKGGPPDELSVRRIGGEQSNTSVALGDALMLKQIRRLAEGVNPEAEVARFLTERAEFPHTPALAGHLEYRDRRGGMTTLAVVQALVADAVDGWQWVLARLREPGAHDVVTDALRRLGQRTGELHRGLACDARDPAFAPEPILGADLAGWTDAVAARLAAARALVGGDTAAVDPATVRAGLAQLVGRQKIRHHGDFHLGQTLYRPAVHDWMIIDFEGEPLRPLPERRRRHAALRDVAGMLRSIDYAAVAALSGDARQARLWEASAARAFVEGYRDAAGPAMFLPPSAAGFDAAVAVFELEKAAYEIAYEADNRPDWVSIPAQGLVRALAKLRRAEAGAA